MLTVDMALLLVFIHRRSLASGSAKRTIVGEIFSASWERTMGRSHLQRMEGVDHPRLYLLWAMDHLGITTSGVSLDLNKG
jgi:hypothetical protein